MARRGDECFETLLVAATPALHAFARRFCVNAADREDLVQDTIEKALAGRTGLVDPRGMRSWLFTIMRHAASATRARAWNRDAPLSLDDIEGPLVPGVAGHNEAGLVHDDARRLLACLHDDQRDAIVLTCVDGMSVEAAARELGVEPGTVKSRVHRGRAAMRLAAERGLSARDRAPDYFARAALEVDRIRDGFENAGRPRAAPASMRADLLRAPLRPRSFSTLRPLAGGTMQGGLHGGQQPGRAPALRGIGRGDIRLLVARAARECARSRETCLIASGA